MTEELRVFVSSVQKELEDERLIVQNLLVEGEELTSRRCEGNYRVTRDTANRDFKVLMELRLARRIGRGRSTRYVLVEAS